MKNMKNFKYLCPLMETIWLNNAPQQRKRSVATIGMFDGVHRGHQLLIGMMTEKARQQGLLSTVVTFDRAPRQVIDPTFQPQLLTTLEEKEEAFRALDIDRFVVLPFTRETATLSARAFMQEILQSLLGVSTLITGYDNRFGHRTTITLPNGTQHAEGFEDYIYYGKELGIEVLRGDVELTADGSYPLSSSIIRQLLAKEGKVELMPAYLGRHYQLSGKVEPGKHIGHRLGFPTANLHPSNPDKLIPACGVYAVWVSLDKEKRPAMMNIGTRPTFDGRSQTLEVNILDFEGDLYDRDISVSFVSRLREERKFDTPKALVWQLKEDRQRVKERLRV